MNLTQFYLYLEKQNKEDKQKTNVNENEIDEYHGQYRDQNCGNILFYLQYLPDMIKWLKFVYSRLNGGLTKKEFKLRWKKIQECINIMLNGY